MSDLGTASLSTVRLKKIFADQEPFFLTDNAELLSELKRVGLISSLLRDAPDPMPEAVVLLAFDFDQLPRANGVLRKLRNSRLLWVPLASFTKDLPSAIYSLRMLLQTDFEETVARNRDIASLFLSTPGPYLFEGIGTNIAFQLTEDVPFISRTRLSLERGESASIGGYTEAGMGVDLADLDVPFRFSGELLVQGILYARHRESPRSLDPLFEAGRGTAMLLAKKLPLRLQITDNRVDPDCFEELQHAVAECTNPEYDWMATELAFGTNLSIAPHIDWSFNSQFNEGIGGMHMALGDGLTGLHIDFICPGGKIDAPGSGTISGFDIV